MNDSNLIKDCKIDFESVSWEKVAPGAFQKRIPFGTMCIRLLRFEEEFEEVDWCSKGHLGFILRGNLIVNFDGKEVRYKEGDGIAIQGGLESKHKAMVDAGSFVEIILFEDT